MGQTKFTPSSVETHTKVIFKKSDFVKAVKESMQKDGYIVEQCAWDKKGNNLIVTAHKPEGQADGKKANQNTGGAQEQK